MDHDGEEILCPKNKSDARNDVLEKSKNFRFLKYFCFVAVFLWIVVESVDYLIEKENVRIRKSLENDRACNSLLDFEDAYLVTLDIIEKYGYPSERHWVTTEDGYILEMHRMPQVKEEDISNSKQFPCKTSNDTVKSQCEGEDPVRVSFKNTKKQQLSNPRPAVFLLHGIFGSSRDFVVNCDRRALAFQLWENGYDVWMGNYRGNKYCRNHTNLNVDSSEFWDFSIDQVGYYDIPAMIDYILNKTELKQISLVAHSMGNGVTFVMVTSRPEYNDKINFWFGMSASNTLAQTKSPFIRMMVPFRGIVEWLLRTFNHGELWPATLGHLFSKYVPLLCSIEGNNKESYLGICSVVNFLVDGYYPGQVPPQLYSVIMGGQPSSTSAKFIVHWLQLVRSGNFTAFDFGPEENLKRYGGKTPSIYQLEKVRIPALVLYADNDFFVTTSDTLKMKEMASRIEIERNPFEFLRVEPVSWNHLSYVHGKDADIYVFPHLLKRLKLIYASNNQTVE